MVAIIGCDYGLHILPEKNFGRRGTNLVPRNYFFSPKFIRLNICNSSAIPLALQARARFDAAKQEMTRMRSAGRAFA
jgi:hypothetical protein